MRTALTHAAMASAIVLLARDSLGGTAVLVPEATSTETEKEAWEYSISTTTTVPLHAQDLVNPNVLADHGVLHLEARYNYEELKTGSAWIGYNFSFGKALVFEATPMIGGVFGNLTGIAPGYEASLTYKKFAVSTQGEFVFDTGNPSGDFFYTWSEVSYAPVEWLRAGLVIERTKAYGTDFDIQRGALLGLTYKKVDLTTYFISPGSRNATLVFTLTVDF